jgi:hypothetical protein
MTAIRYGAMASSILEIAYRQSEQCALKAIERPLKGCEAWTALDLVVRGGCDAVIESCPQLCISAVQARFFGENGGGSKTASGSAAFVPMDQFVGDVMAHVLLATVVTVAVLVPMSTLACLLEAAALVLFLGDELPDIFFSGVTPNTTSLASAFRVGFGKYLADMG